VFTESLPSNGHTRDITFDVLTKVTMKNKAFCVVMPRSSREPEVSKEYTASVSRAGE
jgi:hypothetical protein